MARPLRFLNLPLGLWLLVAPWLLAGATTGAVLNDMATGCLVIALGLPRGRIGKEHYGAWIDTSPDDVTHLRHIIMWLALLIRRR